MRGETFGERKSSMERRERERERGTPGVCVKGIATQSGRGLIKDNSVAFCSRPQQHGLLMEDRKI